MQICQYIHTKQPKPTGYDLITQSEQAQGDSGREKVIDRAFFYFF